MVKLTSPFILHQQSWGRHLCSINSPSWTTTMVKSFSLFSVFFFQHSRSETTYYTANPLNLVFPRFWPGFLAQKCVTQFDYSSSLSSFPDPCFFITFLSFCSCCVSSLFSLDVLCFLHAVLVSEFALLLTCVCWLVCFEFHYLVVSIVFCPVCFELHYLVVPTGCFEFYYQVVSAVCCLVCFELCYLVVFVVRSVLILHVFTWLCPLSVVLCVLSFVTWLCPLFICSNEQCIYRLLHRKCAVWIFHCAHSFVFQSFATRE